MAENTPTILLTNDDGYDAPGLGALHGAISKIAKVEVVAPETQCSAASHAVSVYRDMSYRRIEIRDGFQAHSLTGMPADCVKLALTRLLERKPDLVISGINRGANAGNDILYSGTVAAAIEAAMLGVPSFAVSLAWRSSHQETMHFGAAADFAAEVALLVMRQGLPKGTILNVNVPNLPKDEIKGIVVSRQGKGMYIDVMEPSITEGEISAFRNIGGDIIHSDSALGEDCDDIVVRDGFISVTPLHFDLTYHPFRETLREWFRK